MKAASIFTLLVAASVSAEDLQIPLSTDHVQSPHRVAIIGGGAAGASTAHYLQKFANESRLDKPLQITLFEKEDRIGGRTTTVNALNDTNFPTELGGSIFVRVNHILYNLTQEFGLPANGKVFEGEVTSDYDLGVWDGSQFVFKLSNSEGRWQGYWDIAKLIWKYGLAPIRTRNLARTVVDKFLRFYERPLFPFASLRDVIEETGLLEYISVDGRTLLAAHNADGGFANDIVQASTRVNYAQNLDQIHGIEAMVCMSTEGAMAVDNGNWQIFDQAVKRSGAELFMKTHITKVERHTSKLSTTYRLTTSDGSAHGPFDAVVLAAPHQFAEIEFDPPLEHVPQEIDYVSLHVTLFTSPHLLSPTYFDLPPDAQFQVPSTILTTLSSTTNSDTAQQSKRHNPPFFSISHLRTLYPNEALIAQNANFSVPQHLYKIFSPAPLTATLLSELLNFQHTPVTEKGFLGDPISNLPPWEVSWYHQKMWHSYPYEVPRTEFERIKLDGEDQKDGKGVWYTSGIESFISTMETSALMGRNVAGMVVGELVGGW